MTFPKTRNWRFNARYGALALLAMSLSACSLEERKTARVVIDLSELRSERVAASRWDAPSVNATALSTPAEPTWGTGGRALNTPLSSYNQLHCVMLNVMGEGITSSFTGKPAILPEKWDLTNVCSYVYPGTYSTPVSLDQASIELFLSVQKGPSRLIQVLGFNNATTLRCEDITLPMIVDNDGVDIFELGKTKVDLMSDATVEIQGKVATAKNVKDCGKSEMTVPFGSQRIRIPTKCKAHYADVYLRKKFDDGTLGEQRKINATARVACNIGQGPYIEVNPLSTSALAAQNSGESAVVESDALALDIRWFADTTTSTEAALATLLSARYDVTAPTGTANLALNGNVGFIANFTNLSEAGRASIVSGTTCDTTILPFAPDVDVSAGSSTVALPLESGQTLIDGMTYHLRVRDFAGNPHCLDGASVTFVGGGGNPVPDVASASLSTSGTGPSPTVTATITGITGISTWVLRKGDATSSCQTSIAIGTAIPVTNGQNSSMQNAAVTVPAGVSRFFVGLSDSQGNLICPNLNGSTLNYVEYTNASAGMFTVGFPATSLQLITGQAMGGLQMTNYQGSETIASCSTEGFLPTGLSVFPVVDTNGKNQCAINGTPTGALPSGQLVTVQATASSGATGYAPLTIYVDPPNPRGEILALGGQDSNSGSALTVEVFSKITGSRITSSYLPLPTNGTGYSGWMESAGVKLPDGSILIAGGRNSAGNPHNLAYRLVPGTTAWQAVGQLNVARYGHTMTVIPSSGEVVVVGGADAAGAALASVEVYDPVTKAFKLRAEQLAGGRYGHAAQLLMPATAGVKPSIAVIGGRTSVGNITSATNLVDRIGILEGTGWTVLTSSFPGLPDGGLSMHRAATDDNLHVLTVTGGYSSAGTMSASSYSMDTANPSGGWAASVSMGASRAEHLMVKLNNDASGVRFMAFGGGQNQNSLMMEVLAKIGGSYAWNAFSPSSFSTLLPTLRGAGIARLDSNDGTGNEKFLILGGTSSSGTFNTYGLIVKTPASGNAQMTSAYYIQQPDLLTTPRSDFMLIDF